MLETGESDEREGYGDLSLSEIAEQAMPGGMDDAEFEAIVEKYPAARADRFQLLFVP